ncbi:uncharacterized protein LOC110433601 [Sorghum bicolor]|uniref:uncharacterized protein LOC110433601 n=1 Tax=Sorghum bicolor TaxID=4558 RepID=UPI000B42398F|nr:uncharacterized protein LOC110433601 [Sorghum bicolor]|eukprot:XP_021311749.1 uncharacterized protein LOC110433601 [Sorghum bicolor]
MPFRVPASGVLGPRPGTEANQAFHTAPLAFHGAAPPNLGAQPNNVWNHQAMLAALVNSGVPPSRPQSAEWYFDTGASSHMSSNAGNLSALQPVHTPTPIIIGNGDTLPVTHRARAQIATTRAPLYLDNILVSPSLVKNLISVRSLTHDNNVSIEFDPFGFSVKDLPTRVEILRCNNNGELYPLASSSPQALVTTAPTMELWRQHLGHPRRQDWKIIEQRIEKRLSGWKGKMLTSGGRYSSEELTGCVNGRTYNGVKA